MDDLTESLNAAMAALDSFGFTRAAETLERASTEIDRLRARLEVRDDGGPDGISCRDESIRMQDAEIARLRAENERLKADAADAAPVQQTDPLGYFTFNKEWNVWEQMSAKYKNASDATPLYLHPPSAELARLRAENERLKADAADAARYRWIKRGASFREERDMGPGGCWSIFVAVPRRPAVNSLDTAIDAAMAQGKV